MVAETMITQGRKTTCRKCFVLLIVAITWWLPPVNAQQSLSADRAPSPFQGYWRQLQANPSAVVSDVLLSLEQAEDSADEARLRLLLSRGYMLLSLHGEALQQAELGLTHSLAISPSLQHYLSLARAEALDGLGQAQAGLPQAQRSLDWATSQNDVDLMVVALSTVGYLHLTLSRTDEALNHFQQGFRVAQQGSTLFQSADFSSMIALVHEYRQEHELALPYFQQAETFYRGQGATLELANTLYGMGRSYLALGQTEKGKPLLEDSATLALEINDHQGAAYSYQSIANILFEEGFVTDAKVYLDRALALFTEAQNPYMIISVLLQEANIALRQDDPAGCLDLIRQASDVAVGESFTPQRIQIAEFAAQCYAAQSLYQKAYETLLEKEAAQQNLLREQNSQRLMKLKTDFEIERQTAQNQLLKEQNLRQQSQLIHEKRQGNSMILLSVSLLIICILLMCLFVINQRHRRRLEQLASEDELTGLINRRETLKRLSQQLALMRRNPAPMTLALIDLDQFKSINDTFGHQVGDQVLKQFGRLARKTFRKTDILGRIGGEEFLFAFPDSDLPPTERMLSDFAEQVRQIPHTLPYSGLNVSLSAGLIQARPEDTEASLMALADKGLYQAKIGGRDQIVSPSAREHDLAQPS